jgi:hypothetical protein
MISNIEINKSDTMKTSYQVLTDKYHYFAPQPFFSSKKIAPDIGFLKFISKLTIWLIDDQFDFSLDRMNYGQKAKFILSKSEFGEKYLFQIDNREFHENRGIIEMIEACLKLWKTAGIFEGN